MIEAGACKPVHDVLGVRVARGYPLGTDGAQEHDGDKNTTPQTAFDLNDGA